MSCIDDVSLLLFMYWKLFVFLCLLDKGVILFPCIPAPFLTLYTASFIFFFSDKNETNIHQKQHLTVTSAQV